MISKQKKEVLFKALVCQIWIFYKNDNKRNNSKGACTRNESWVKVKMATATKAGECLSLFYYLSNKEIETKRNNYYCTLIKIINTFRILLILSIKSKQYFNVQSFERRMEFDS